MRDFPSHDIRKIIDDDAVFILKIMMIIQLNVKKSMVKIKFYELRLVYYRRKNKIKNRNTTERHTYMCHQNIKSVEMGLTAAASNFIYFFHNTFNQSFNDAYELFIVFIYNE